MLLALVPDGLGPRAGRGGQPMSAVERVRAAYAAIDAAGRPEVWITLRPAADALAEADAIDARAAAGEALPLAGLVAAVKDNIDVAGLPTTAGAPSYAYRPAQDATSVARLRAAGTIVLGKTNLDQFATGLVGTRSPYGAVRGAWDPERISGGSSSGSAVAVALGLVDFSLGTDTAGSGRVPAALNGIVGLKPTRGVIPCTGVVPACRSLDCVTVFARSVLLARRAVAVMAGPDGADPLATLLGSRPRGGWRPRRRRPGPPRRPAAIPARRASPTAGRRRSRRPSRDCGRPAPRSSPSTSRPCWKPRACCTADRSSPSGTRRSATTSASTPRSSAATLTRSSRRSSSTRAKHGAADYFADRERLDRLAARAADALDGCDALLTPTTTLHPTIAEVRDDPVGVNSRLGTYTNFANLLDLAALAVPAGTVAGLPFGIMLTGPAGSDARLAEIAASCDQASVDLLVVGAHLSGQPLNHELLAAGGTLLRPAATAPAYRLYALDTQPPKPGLVRVEALPAADAGAPAAGQAGASIAGEVWRLPAAGFARFMTGLAVPMAIGRVCLDDGRDVLGFLCEPAAVRGAADITRFGGWRSWIGRR